MARTSDAGEIHRGVLPAPANRKPIEERSEHRSRGRAHSGPAGRSRCERLPSYAIHLSFSPDGEVLAIGLRDRGTELRDSRSLRTVARLRNATGEDADRWVRFSPDGRLLAVSSDRGDTQLWDVAARRRTGPRPTGHEGGVLNAEDSGLDGALKPP